VFGIRPGKRKFWEGKINTSGSDVNKFEVGGELIFAVDIGFISDFWDLTRSRVDAWYGFDGMMYDRYDDHATRTVIQMKMGGQFSMTGVEFGVLVNLAVTQNYMRRGVE